MRHVDAMHACGCHENCRNCAGHAVAQAHVANVLGALALKGQGGVSAAEQAARQVAHAQARALLLPVLDNAIGRLAAVMRRTWQLAVDHALPDGKRPMGFGGP